MPLIHSFFISYKYPWFTKEGEDHIQKRLVFYCLYMIRVSRLSIPQGVDCVHEVLDLVQGNQPKWNTPSF